MADLQNEQDARGKIDALVAEYYCDFNVPAESKENLKSGDRGSYDSHVYDGEEMQSLTDDMLDFWLTTGTFSNVFEVQFALWIGVEQLKKFPSFVDRRIHNWERLLFSGNLITHPCFDQICGTDACRVAGSLDNTEFIMDNVLSRHNRYYGRLYGAGYY